MDDEELGIMARLVEALGEFLDVALDWLVDVLTDRVTLTTAAIVGLSLAASIIATNFIKGPFGDFIRSKRWYKLSVQMFAFAVGFFTVKYSLPEFVEFSPGMLQIICITTGFGTFAAYDLWTKVLAPRFFHKRITHD